MWIPLTNNNQVSHWHTKETIVLTTNRGRITQDIDLKMHIGYGIIVTSAAF
jgi:hypothetical protein